MHPCCEHGHRVWRYQKIYAGLPGEIENHGCIFTCKIFLLPGIGFDEPLAQQKGNCHIRGGYPNPCITEARGGYPYNWITKTRGGYPYPWITKNRDGYPTLGSPHHWWVPLPLDHQNQGWIPLPLDHQNQGWIPLPLDHHNHQNYTKLTALIVRVLDFVS